VLVTGASGFIGRHLVARLDQLGKRVVRVSRQDGFDILRDKLPVQGVDHVFHLAARTGVPEAWRSTLDYLDTNVLGTARMLEQCRDQCSVTFVSGYVYGNPRRLPISEIDPIAQIVIESWRRHYNTIRPHASIGYKPPAPEVFVPAFAAWPAALRRPAPPATLAQRPTLN
jgi:nucleoside-diphosphate-sugar epimerase